MASLCLNRGLEASLLARDAVRSRRVVAATAARFSSASLRPVAASRSLRQRHHDREQRQQQHRKLSGTTTFDYKPLFQYGATPRDDPPEVNSVGYCWKPARCFSQVAAGVVGSRPSPLTSPSLRPASATRPASDCLCFAVLWLGRTSTRILLLGVRSNYEAV